LQGRYKDCEDIVPMMIEEVDEAKIQTLDFVVLTCLARCALLVKDRNFPTLQELFRFILELFIFEKANFKLSC
jgi:hypothetical protein